ncbi:extracellular solute-binding protein [Acuticoccus sp. MNP-M23]|uniref:extracellular solute-binding protein n=1 Tax=Acuticoccus sp. MNP-M23 TaxID=3072793 RepID=UPI002814F921|nr:extracellular solute-binding protein [Acuticoccus sp. MNP-M23]WMS41556.1 extracellular solute-binding protein [Acuticoccus sp. MNP-M23]
MTGLTRRRVLVLSGAAALAAHPDLVLAQASSEAGAAGATVAGAGPRHALSVFGAPQYGADFKHFSYVNPDAPKQGRINLTPSRWTTNQNPITFNTFNMLILRGDSPAFMELTHAALMTRNLDEPDAVYPLIAESVVVDGRAYTFRLREDATFSDGSTITAEDVAFTYETLGKKGHPLLRQLLSGVEKVDVETPLSARITFRDGTSNRLPPLVSAEIPIISKAYYTANDIEDATLTVPVTSGAYTVGDYRAGRYVVFDRRPDDWSTNVPSRVGHNNFDSVRVDFFRERITGFEAFKKGDITFREEFTSKTWATEYNFPAIEDGRVLKRTFPDQRPSGAQGMFINTRRKKFADPRTRQALGTAFDFEWTNENIFYGLYDRTVSFFMNSDMMATGDPDPAELALLEPFRDQIPAEAFGPAWLPPQTDGSGRDRAPLREGARLLKEAGWERDGSGLVNADGERLTVEFLYAQPYWDKILQPFATRLGLLGVEVTLRVVESAQYQSRTKSFDFDLAIQRLSLAPTPGESIREFWTSAAAKTEGSYNLAGISDPVVDALVQTMITAPTRDEMVTAARALDRVLRVGHYWVPQWYSGTHKVAYWDQFGIPETKPKYDLPVETTWWAKDA